MRLFLRLARRDQSGFLAVAFLVLASAPLGAQGVFVPVATKIAAEVASVTNILGIIAITLAGLTMAFGSHGMKEQIGGKLVGLGLASFAPQIYLWLF